MSSHRGLPGTIIVVSQRLPKASVLRQVLVVRSTGLGDLGVKFLARSSYERDGDRLLCNRGQVQPFGTSPVHEIAVQGEIDSPLGCPWVIDAMRIIHGS